MRPALLLTIGFFWFHSPCLADLPVASSIKAYYQEAARSQRGPRGEIYVQSHSKVHELAWPEQNLTDERLALSVVREVDLMLESLGIDPLLAGYGLHRDLSYPAALAPRLKGRVAESVVWLAACHGLISATDDPWARYFSPEEYNGMQCGRYIGPPIRPEYDR